MTNGRGPCKILVLCYAAEHMSSQVFGSAFAQVKKLGLSNHLFIALKEGTNEQIVSLFCQGCNWVWPGCVENTSMAPRQEGVH